MAGYCKNIMVHRGLDTFSPDAYDPYTRKMVKLCTGVLSDANVIAMQSLGEFSLLECTWCKDHNDYFLFSAPYVGAYYIWFLVVAGFLSASEKMYSWRYATLVATGLMLMMETGFRLTDNSAISFSQDWGFLAYETQHIVLQRYPPPSLLNLGFDVLYSQSP